MTVLVFRLLALVLLWLAAGVIFGLLGYWHGRDMERRLAGIKAAAREAMEVQDEEIERYRDSDGSVSCNGRRCYFAVINGGKRERGPYARGSR
jgi:uncharacterized membrane protein